MPTLPTLTVTDAQASRIIAAFGDGATYKAWLKSQVIDYVVTFEERADYTNYLAERKQKNDQIKSDLNSAT